MLFDIVPAFILLLLVLALFISALGFYKTIFFITLGYAFSIAAMAVVTTIHYASQLTLVSILQNVLLLIWSVRLGIYLIQRETLPAFSNQRKLNQERTARITLPIKFAIWASVSLLYVAMYSPALFVYSHAPVDTDRSLIPWVGVVVMLAGLVIESVGDQQKSDFKAKFPKSFCNVGLYRWVRCPNYLGEILFWVGNWVIGVAFYSNLAEWAISLIGAVCITLIMMGSAKRLEASQYERYGDDPNYQTYIRTVPILFPFVPVYTLKNVRVYLE